jgi:GGDEF domain-containing protein
MISLKHYLFPEADQNAARAYRHIIDLMLQGLALHDGQGEQIEYERFRADMDRFATHLISDVEPAELLALEQYNRSTSALIERQNTALHHLVSALTQTIIKVGANRETSAAGLREIEKVLEQTRMVKDIERLKIRLSEFLETVREQAARQKADTQNTIVALERELQLSAQDAQGVPRVRDRDPVTGLLSRNEAELALKAAAASADGKFVVVAVVNRVQTVNARFGYAVGDRLMATCAQHYRARLSASDELYRWHGPAFLGLLSRQVRIDQVRGEIRLFASAKLESMVEVGNRTVHIPVSSNWSVIPAAPPPEALSKKIDTFIATQVTRDYA